MPTRSKELPDTAGSTATIQNKVHQLIEYIENNFSKEGRFRKSFADAALTGALRFLDEIASAEGISHRKKIQLLTRIYQAANSRIEGLNAPPVVAPLAKWAERKERFISPCDFLVTHFPSYGRGLNLAQVRQADPQLYQALMRLKSERGWPGSFHIPSKSEQMDALVEAAGESDVAQRDDLPVAERKRRRQIVNARRYRARKT